MKKLVVNIKEGEEEYLDLTAEDIAARQCDAAREETQRLADAEKAKARASLVTKLKLQGFTDDEIAAL